MEYIHHYKSPLGGITMASDGKALIGLWFDGQKYFAVTLSKEHEEKMLPVFEETDRWLDIYFQGKEPDFLPLVLFPCGSEFRQEVWQILLSIPVWKNHDLWGNRCIYCQTAWAYTNVSAGSGRCGRS